MDQYLQALKKEIQLVTEVNDLFHETPATIYIGGGTPSYLSSRQLQRLLETIGCYFEVDEAVEFSIEANPGSLTEEKLRVILSNGVNRLSIGVQSFDNKLLKRIGRLHEADTARNAVAMARAAGVKNISIDIIYGLPGETMEQLQADVAEAAGLNVEHISVYGLQVEDGTVFSRLQEQGRLDLPESEISEAMYDYITEALPQAGFERYEISNYAKTGFESRHNLSYWQDIPYLGLGAGAHTYWEGKRYAKSPDIKEYISALSKNVLPWKLEEELSEKAHMEEFCFLALRTARGIDRGRFAEVFGQQIEDVYGPRLTALKRQEMIVADDEGVRLTAQGMKLGNRVFAEFLL